MFAFPKGSKVLDLTKMGANPKPMKGGTFNAYNPVNSESGMSRDARMELLKSMDPDMSRGDQMKLMKSMGMEDGRTRG